MTTDRIFATTLSPDERKVSEILFQNRVSRELYNHNLTTYTGAAHFLSSAANISNAAEVYLLGYKLSDIVLNLKPEHIVGLNHPTTFAAFGTERLQGFIDKMDHGYLFAALCQVYGKSSGQDYDEKLSNALRTLGLPSSETINAEYLEEMLQPPTASLDVIREPVLQELRLNFSMMGASISNARSKIVSGMPITAHEYIANQLPLPIIITGDCEQISLNRAGLPERDHDNLYKVMHRLDTHTRNSLRASRGFDFDMGDYTY